MEWRHGNRIIDTPFAMKVPRCWDPLVEQTHGKASHDRFLLSVPTGELHPFKPWAL